MSFPKLSVNFYVFFCRTWEEFQEFQHHLDKDIFLNPDMTLPEEPTVSNLNEYLQNGTESHRLMTSNLCYDFLGINWDGSDLKWFESMKEFLKVNIFNITLEYLK